MQVSVCVGVCDTRIMGCGYLYVLVYVIQGLWGAGIYMCWCERYKDHGVRGSVCVCCDPRIVIQGSQGVGIFMCWCVRDTRITGCWYLHVLVCVIQGSWGVGICMCWCARDTRIMGCWYLHVLVCVIQGSRGAGIYLYVLV